MELTYVTIVVLASMIFVLSGMVGYLYWQQTRMLQHLQALSIVISTHFVQQPPELKVEHEEVHEEEVEESENEEDDRISVKEEVDHVEGPQISVTETGVIKESTETKVAEDKVDIDDLQDKTAAQLRELLTKKGIPFGKRDTKPVLIQLLKATA